MDQAAGIELELARGGDPSIEGMHGCRRGLDAGGRYGGWRQGDRRLHFGFRQGFRIAMARSGGCFLAAAGKKDHEGDRYRPKNGS